MCQTITKAMSQQMQSDLCVENRPFLPKLDILAVDADEDLEEEQEAEDHVKGGSLYPHEVRTARQKGNTVSAGHGGV